MTKSKAYIASGWFSKAQEQGRVYAIDLLNSLDYAFFSPKDDNLGPADATLALQDRVVKGNCNAILESKFILASVVGADMGTVWEIGYALANRIPVLIWDPESRIGFALATLNVARTKETLEQKLTELIANV